MAKEPIRKFLKMNRQKRLSIHCLGDAMIDEYYAVKVNRISPEFPMPIMWSPLDQWTIRPGGIANVVHQFKHFNVHSMLHCFPDKSSETILAENALMVHDAHRARFNMTQHYDSRWPIKRRYLDNGIQIVRHDIETPLCGWSPEKVAEYIAELGSHIGSLDPPDVVICSDYDKGFFSSDRNVLEFYPGVVSIVDPKRGPLSKWKGCTIFKPNAKEARDLSGLTDWQEQAKLFQRELGCRAVVITHGGEQVVGIDGGELFSYQPTKSVAVESVVGAGDCFCAFFAMAVGHGFSIMEAAEIAWNAGAVYVQGRMNRPIIPAELAPDGLVEPEDLFDRDFKLVFTNGCFDLLHQGHLSILEFAKEKGDKLVVALNTDASIRRIKGKDRPIMPLEQRMSVMASLKPVDFVVSFDEDTPLEVIKKIRPDVLVKGQDYSLENIVGADIVPEVCRAPILQGLSSTKFIEKG